MPCTCPCEEGYLTDLLSRRAVDFVNRTAATGQPFFLSLHYTAPHWPWESRADAHVANRVKDSLYHLDGGNIETYRQMIHHMDEGIGWVMDALARNGLQENTLVIFSSDNGGERFSDNWPLVGGKMDLTEGGIRVPWIAHGPAVIGGRGVCEQHCMTMDWSTTVLDLAQVQPHPDYPLDGVSLRRVLADPEDCFDRPLYWRMKHPSQRALRKGPWKYLRVDEHEYLFNVEDDARERANVAKREPGLLAQMKQDWEAWEKTMPAIPPDAQVRLAYGAADMPSR